MIRIALWLTLFGREQRIRLLVTSAGIALGVGLLLLAAVAWPAIRAHEARDAWTNTSAHNARPGQEETTTDPMLWRVRIDSFQGQDVVRVDVAPLGPRAPIPPGLARLPAPGEKATSPALARLMAAVPPQELADRYPGQTVATVGDAALKYPGQLVVFVGYDADQLRGQPGVESVRSMETQPTSVSLTRFGRLIVAMAAAALLVPVLVLVATATRLSAARREQRLAAVRLVGATPGDIRLACTTEILCAATIGTLLGFVAFAASRPYAAHWAVDGSPFFPQDLRLSWGAGMLVALGIPVLAVAAALTALRRVQISPLGVTRRAPARPPTWRRLVLLVVGLAALALALPVVAASRSEGLMWLLIGATTTVILGILVAGPWLTMGVGRMLIGVARRPAGLLAGHRLATDPRAGFRSISGLVLTVFLVTVAAMATASSSVPVAESGQVLIPQGSVGLEFLYRDTPLYPSDQATALVRRLRAIPGVAAVLDLRWAATTPATPQASTLPVVASCADLRATGIVHCADPSAQIGLDARLLGNGFVQGVGTPMTQTAATRLPMLGVLVMTDNRPQTIETVRTAMETSAPQAAWLPWTTSELKAHTNKQAEAVRRISGAILIATLIIAGFSLAVSVAGSLLERKRPFALLRLAGASAGQLRAVLVAETAVPLITATLVSAAIGVAVASDMTHASHLPWRAPAASYWWILGAGTAVALATALLTTIPLLGKLTSPDTARFE